MWSDVMVSVGAERAPASASDGLSLSCDIVERLCFCVSAWLRLEREPCAENGSSESLPSPQLLLGMVPSKLT